MSDETNQLNESIERPPEPLDPELLRQLLEIQTQQIALQQFDRQLREREIETNHEYSLARLYPF